MQMWQENINSENRVKTQLLELSQIYNANWNIVTIFNYIYIYNYSGSKAKL